MTRIKAAAAAITLAGGMMFSGTAHALCAAPPTMSGTWKANDGGTYYVRQSGNEIWWLGMSKDGGKTFTNVFHGTRSGNTVTGRWSDVPKGGAVSGGAMTLTVFGTNGVLGWKRASATGGFGGSNWFKPCDDTVLNPVGN